MDTFGCSPTDNIPQTGNSNFFYENEKKYKKKKFVFNQLNCYLPLPLVLSSVPFTCRAKGESGLHLVTLKFFQHHYCHNAESVVEIVVTMQNKAMLVLLLLLLFFLCFVLF